MAGTISVEICDDHTLVRSGLRRLLEAESDFEVVGEAANAEEALIEVRLRRPDVLVLDIVMLGRSGIEVLPEIAAASPNTKVLVLSMHDDPLYTRHAFDAGATGYLPKEAAEVDLLQAIREVAAGRRYVHPLIGARLADAEADAKRRTQTDSLSEREHEVLHLLALGHTNHEIANLLSISFRTVESHRARIMLKLGVKTRAELVHFALASGELDSDP